MNASMTRWTAALCLCAAPLAAQQVDWNRDPAAGFPGLKAKSAPVAAPAAGATKAVPGPEARSIERIYATSLGSEELGPFGSRGWERRVDLMLNGAGDALGAVYTNCSSQFDDDAPPCETLQFVFQGLRVDRATRTVYRGDEALGTLSGRRGAALSGWRVRYELKNELVSRDPYGFRRERATIVKVFLERTGR